MWCDGERHLLKDLLDAVLETEPGAERLGKQTHHIVFAVHERGAFVS